MDEEKKQESPAWREFLVTVEKTGAYCEIWEEPAKEGDKPGKKGYNVNKGADLKDHFITDEKLISFRPLSRRERRTNFHTKRVVKLVA